MRARFALPTLFLALATWALPTHSQPLPSSRILAPTFEVDLSQPGRSATLSLSNDAEVPVVVDVGVYSNWGIRVLGLTLRIGPNEVHTCNLADWIVEGKLPDRTLSAAQLAHLQAALSGKPSPKTGLYYGTEIEPDRATGYVIFRIKGPKPPDSLWGDYFVLERLADFEQAETLVNLDRGVKCYSCCQRQAIRFQECADTGVSTDLHIWTAHQGSPQPTPEPDATELVSVTLLFFDDGGRLVARRDLSVIPQSRLDVCDLEVGAPFGWVEILSPEEFFVTGHYTFIEGESAALHGYCLPLEHAFEGPAIELEKRTFGVDADNPPGVTVQFGGPVEWAYVVTNIGSRPLTDIVVTDSVPGVDVTCPGASLAPGESMTCTASGTAEHCRYRNLGTATGFAPDGTMVSDEDPSHYHASTGASIALEKRTNGEDADTPPGPAIDAGDPVVWTYEVTNAGPAPVTSIEVSDSEGAAVACPGEALEPGDSMVCTANGVAREGAYANIGYVRGRDSCEVEIAASDPSHYVGRLSRPAVDIEKLTNGHDADTPTGPRIPAGDPVFWTYVVTNIGNERLTGLAVTDDQGVAVTCPRSLLEPGETMTCTADGSAVLGQYANLGTVQGTTPSGGPIAANDPSHYLGVETGDGDRGCSPGYWKNHPSSWAATGYDPSQSVVSVFGAAGAYPDLGGASLLEALAFGGGTGVEGAARILLRAGVAALLNASHPDVDFPRTATSVQSNVDTALATGDRDAMLLLAAALDADNNLGCPLG